eukprot:TRINITY_DN392_c0_g1_i2.p1 TRINITY_DN392_c0_g1~~TRINITY_DN392_c0_g1_i2.p1  ORF type:complete len:519 (-),score=91.75 TRINITY_DN392_c0_g1_i2:1535-3091(-)
MNIDEFNFDPPKEILDRFAKVANQRAEYDKARVDIRRNILSKLQHEIKSIGESCTDKFQDHKITLELALDTIPEDMKKPLLKRLDSAIKSRDTRILLYQKDVQRVLHKGETNKVQRLYDKYEEIGNQSILNQIVDHVSNKFDSLRCKVFENFEQNSFDNAFAEIHYLDEYQKAFGTKMLPRITDEYKEVLSQVSQKVINTCQLMLSCQKFSAKDLEEKFRLVLSFMNHTKKNNLLLQHEVVKAMDQLHNGFSKYVDNIKLDCQKYLTMLEDIKFESDSILDLKILSISLDTLEESQAFFKIIRSYVDSHGDSDFKSIQKLKVVIESMIQYEDVVQKISQKLAAERKYFQDHVMDEFVSGSNNEVRKEFCVQLNNRLTFLRETNHLKKHVHNKHLLGCNLSSLYDDALKIVQIRCELLTSQAQDALPSVFMRSIQACNKFNFAYSNLGLLCNNIPVLKEAIEKDINIIETSLVSLIENMVDSVSDFNVEPFGKILIKMQFISNNVYPAKEKMVKKLLFS